MKNIDWRKKLEYGGQDEKYRSVIIDIIPCVVKSLETDAVMAIVAYVDKLMVRPTSAQSRKEGSQG